MENKLPLIYPTGSVSQTWHAGLSFSGGRDRPGRRVGVPPSPPLRKPEGPTVCPLTPATGSELLVPGSVRGLERKLTSGGSVDPFQGCGGLLPGVWVSILSFLQGCGQSSLRSGGAAPSKRVDRASARSGGVDPFLLGRGWSSLQGCGLVQGAGGAVETCHNQQQWEWLAP